MAKKNNRNRQASLSASPQREAQLPREAEKSLRLDIKRITDKIFAEDGNTLEAVCTIAVTAFDYADKMVAEVQQGLPPEHPIACQAGCSWCCHMPVAVSVPEAVLIADVLRSNLSTSEFEQLAARVHDLAIKRVSMPVGDINHTPCPLLADGRCSIYAIRPLSCRGLNSYRARDCEDGFRTGDSRIHTYGPQHAIYNQIGAGLLFAAADRGLDPRPLELIAALDLAMHNPNSWEAWLRLEPTWEAAGFPSALPNHPTTPIDEEALRRAMTRKVNSKAQTPPSGG